MRGPKFIEKMMECYDDDIPSNKVIELVLRRIITHLLAVAKETLKWENMLFRIFFDKFPELRVYHFNRHGC